MIEREIKSMATQTLMLQYKSILDNLVDPKRILQINYYFDTPDFQLNSLGNTLRVRQINNELVLQYKYDKHYNGTEKTCEEFEISIQALPLYILSNALPNDTHNPALHYNYIGSLVTERLDYLYGQAIISLDKSYYLGKCDCEIEVEFQDYKMANEILRLLSIEEIETFEMGKYSRFAREYKRLGIEND